MHDECLRLVQGNVVVDVLGAGDSIRSKHDIAGHILDLQSVVYHLGQYPRKQLLDINARASEGATEGQKARFTHSRLALPYRLVNSVLRVYGISKGSIYLWYGVCHSRVAVGVRAEANKCV